MIKNQSPEDILFAFSVEPKHDRETLERYIRRHPELAGELVDLMHELQIGERQPGNRMRNQNQTK